MSKSVTKSDIARASSAGARINIPLNLQNFKAYPKETHGLLLWFHQHVLDEHYTLDEAGKSIQYDKSTVYRLLRGIYEGSIEKVCSAIESYKRIAEERATIQGNEIVENGITRMIGAGLDYALSNNSITMIIGESRMGKTESAKLWRDANNHGTSVLVTAPPIGGSKVLLQRIAMAVGVNKNKSMADIFDAISRSFNRNRILIVDEAHRLMPGGRSSNPVNLEILRDLHDQTGCALALIATQRFSDELYKSSYQFEQVLGRIGMPIRLKRTIPEKDFRPIIEQYLPEPSRELLDHCKAIANEQGRLGILVEDLKVASRIAGKMKQDLTEEHFFKALKLRDQMMGEKQYARKG
jgi:DNA transposition AAA+ family ATPase